MWGEYLKTNLDLSPDGPIISSRPYVQGRQSLDTTKVFVRFITGETSWPTPIALFNTAEEARAGITTSDYVAPPTQEEIDAEKAAVADTREYRLNLEVDKVVEKYMDGAAEAGYRYDNLGVEAQAVRDGGDLPGNALIDDLVSRSDGATITQVVDSVLNDVQQARDKIKTAENIRRQALREIKKATPDPDLLTTLRDELRAL